MDLEKVSLPDRASHAELELDYMMPKAFCFSFFNSDRIMNSKKIM